MPTEFVDTTIPEPETNLGPPKRSYSSFRLPRELALYVSRTDDTLLRLNKLLSTTAGLEYLLSTLNYSSYLLTFLYAHTPSRAKLRLLLSRIPLLSHTFHPTISKANKPSDTPSTASRLANLTTFLTNTRTSLRLAALFPLYAWLRTLLVSTSKPLDPYLYAIALTQCLSYIIYQALENVAHLIDLRILPASSSLFKPLRSTSPTITTSPSSSTAKLWLLSSRFWLAGVSCDIFRLLREAYVQAQERRRRRRLQPTSTSLSSESEKYQKEYALAAAEAEVADRRWWSELFVAGCWLPMCAHYSVDGGLFRPSIENGVVGALGLAASWEGWRVAWAETKG